MVKRGNKMPKESLNKNIEVLAEDLSKAKLVGAENLIPLMAGETIASYATIYTIF